MSEEPKFVVFAEVPYSLGSANKIMEIQNRHSIPKHVHIHTRDLEIRLVNERRERLAGMEFFGREPRFHGKDSPGTKVFAHGPDRLAELLQLSNVTDGAKKTDHRIKSAAQIEIDHIGLIKADAGESTASDGEHLRILVETDDFKVINQVQGMTAGPAGRLQQSVSR